MTKYVELPSGAIIDIDNIAFILRAELNKFIIVPKQSISPNIPFLDGNETDALKVFLKVEKIPYTPPAAEEKPLIARVDEGKQFV